MMQRAVRRAVLCGFASLSVFGAGVLSTEAVAAKSDDQTPINIVAAKLDYFDKQQELVYTGSVVATRGDTILKTPKLTVFLAPKAKGPNAPKSSSSDRVRRMEAMGPVTLISNDQIATGDSAIYQKTEDKVYMNGNVRLTQGPNVTLGDHIVYDLKTTQAVVTGHVRSLFIPDSDNNSSSTSTADTTSAAKPKPKRLHRVHRPESAQQ